MYGIVSKFKRKSRLEANNRKKEEKKRPPKHRRKVPLKRQQKTEKTAID